MSHPYMPMYWGDFLRDTTGLNAEESGAYLMLIGALWNAGGILPDDPKALARHGRVTPRRWPKVWAEISIYFEHRSNAIGSWIENNRVTQELTKADVKRARFSDNGKLGARQKWKKNNGRSMAGLKPGHKQPEPEPNITSASLVAARGGLSAVRSLDRETLEQFAMRETAADSGGDNEDR